MVEVNPRRGVGEGRGGGRRRLRSSLAEVLVPPACTPMARTNLQSCMLAASLQGWWQHFRDPRFVMMCRMRHCASFAVLGQHTPLQLLVTFQ